MIKTVVADGRAEFLALEKMENRANGRSRETEETVLRILDDVRENGDAALQKYNEKFDGGRPDSLEAGKDACKAAFDAAEPAFRGALERAADNIRAYHEKQIAGGYELKKADGAVLGQIVRGLARVGIYVPGGTAAYPSTVLMNAIPAKLAGVAEIVMATPPAALGGTGQGSTGGRFGANPDILAAAWVAGVDRVFLSGGAQTVAALAYGTERIPRVDKIVGPGNIFVATAKKLLYGQVDIDMIAGPSEILVMADDTADPAYIAADMLSQAEHDVNSAAVLLTTGAETAEKTKAQLAAQSENLARRDIVRASLENFGLILLCRGTEEMIRMANHIAPEHLEILTADPMAVLAEIKNAGSVFCGPYSPEPLGDYYAGTNHVLPTSGTARFASPLGVYDFVKRMSYTYYTKESLLAAKDDIVRIAGREGFGAHANAVRIRFDGE
ncbi:MAG: histidinol dehydrogenase [Clostridiales Family XIII bacterium]|jgi:histidinol dehydrogenase|nr:histidinol dehydrogenase [Clostridiales Family XIII bacterium]